jgi:hypothetical protein
MVDTGPEPPFALSTISNLTGGHLQGIGGIELNAVALHSILV